MKGGKDDSGSLKDTKEDMSSKGEYTYEEVIHSLGKGKFNFILLVFAGLTSMADSIEILSLSMILPSATCDLHLSTYIKGWIDASVFIGMFVGGLFWGSISDLTGRRTVLLITLTINWTCALTSSFLFNYTEYFVLRCLSGIGIGGSVPVVFAYFSEFQHKSRRGKMLSLLTFCWMCGNFIETGFTTPWIDYRGWRFFTAVCAAPSFFATIAFIFMPESPKYYLQKGKQEESIAILQKIYKFTHGKEMYKIRKLRMGSGETDTLINSSKKLPKDPTKKGNPSRFKRCYKFLLDVLFVMASLFERRYRVLTGVLAFIFATFSFSYYGMFMWFPELFVQIEQCGTVSCNGPPKINNTTAVFNESMSAIFNESMSRDSKCQGVSQFVYLQTFVIMIASSFSAILPIFLTDMVGRKFIFGFGLFFAGLSVFFLSAATNLITVFITSCIFSIFVGIINCMLEVVVVEVYPTKLRSTAIGFHCGAMRIVAVIANVTFGVLVEENGALVILLCSGCLFSAGLATIKLPDMNQKEIG